MRVAVYGGTFDPPHSTHLLVASSALERGLAERVLFVPSADPPHKIGHHVTPFAHRLKMLELAIAGKPNFEISDIEAKRLPEPSYTFETMEELSALRPDDKFTILMGSDSLSALHTWHRAEELAARYSFAIYPREGKVPSLEELLAQWPEKTARRLFSSIILDAPQTDLSSSSLRSALVNLENAGRFISKDVLAYIKANGLYENKKYGVQADAKHQED